MFTDVLQSSEEEAAISQTVPDAVRGAEADAGTRTWFGWSV